MRQLVVLLALSLQFSACGESSEPIDGPVTQSELSDDRRVVLMDDDTLPAEDQTSETGVGFIDGNEPSANDETPAENFIEPAEMPIEEAPAESPSDPNEEMAGPDEAGMMPGLPAEFIFDPAHEGVVAQFEFNGTADDVSGADRNGVLIGGEFVASEFGQGLRVGDSDHGFDWSRHSFFLSHPYTIEMVLTPSAESATFSKLLGHDDSEESGWYLYSGGFRPYPINGGTSGADMMPYGQRTYLAVVSVSDSLIDVYINGAKVTDEPIESQCPDSPDQAIFFRDDASPSRYETLHAVIDGLRISSVSRSAADIALTQNRLAD